VARFRLEDGGTASHSAPVARRRTSDWGGKPAGGNVRRSA